MIRQVRTAIVTFLLLTILTGGIYPLFVTAVAQGLFPHQSTGSLIVDEGQPVGSELIGQSFTRPEYFWGRLSATAPSAYNAGASSGSNFGPLNPALSAAAEARIAALVASGSPGKSIPVDLITSSASGLDPHISPAAAEFQVPRVARSRQFTEDAVRSLVKHATAGRQLSLFGEPRVNVLQLNLALDRLARE